MPKGGRVSLAVLMVSGGNGSFCCIQPGATLAMNRVERDRFTAPAKFSPCAELPG